MVRHYRGTFFKGKANHDSTDEESSGNEADDEGPTKQRKRKRKEPTSSAKAKRPKTDNEEAKFKKTDDEWNVDPKLWDVIGQDQAASAGTFPSRFGRAPRNFAKHCHHFSGEEWKQQGLLFLPIYLEPHLPEVHYDAFCNLMRVIGLSTENVLTDDEIKSVEVHMRAFSEYYENTFYGRKWNNLPACLPVFHQLIHVADALRWIGPMHTYAQWAMERMCGMLTRTATSRVEANRNMAIHLVMTEQKHVLPYVLHPEDWGQESLAFSDDEFDEDDNSGAVEDADGNLMLSRVFQSRMAESGVHPRERLKKGSIQHILKGFVHSRPPVGIEKQRIQAFMSIQPGYDIQMSVPESIGIYKWCRYRTRGLTTQPDYQVCNIPHGIKFNGKFHLISLQVTSWNHKPHNNTRCASYIAYSNGKDDDSMNFGKVLFFFTARLPMDLEGDVHAREGNSDSDDADTALYRLAYIKEIPVEKDGWLLCRVRNKGGHRVIAANQIQKLIGFMKRGNDQYLTSRYTSQLA
jgi:predicted RNA binding protein YcfA (HicA-like mRNA interferase family)